MEGVLQRAMEFPLLGSSLVLTVMSIPSWPEGLS